MQRKENIFLVEKFVSIQDIESDQTAENGFGSKGKDEVRWNPSDFQIALMGGKDFGAEQFFLHEVDREHKPEEVRGCPMVQILSRGKEIEQVKVIEDGVINGQGEPFDRFLNALMYGKETRMEGNAFLCPFQLE